MSRAARSIPPWWRAYFDDAYFKLHEPLFPPERSRREVAGMIELLGLPQGSRILDAPCGWARHTALLREAGFEAVGADLSWAQLERAARRRRPPLVAADLRALPFRDACFDAVINVFTGFGLFGDDREDIRALREARRLLVPGGRILIETMHRDDVVADYAERDAWTLPDGTRVSVERTFDPVAGISHERLEWRRGSRRGEKVNALRLRTATEIAGLLHKAGFRRPEWYGDWDGSPFTHRAASLIIVADAPRPRLPERVGPR